MWFFRYSMAITKGLKKLLIFFNWAYRNAARAPNFFSNFVRQQPCTRITDMITQDEFAWYFINFSPLLL